MKNYEYCQEGPLVDSCIAKNQYYTGSKAHTACPMDKICNDISIDVVQEYYEATPLQLNH